MDETMKIYMPRKQWGETIPITARPKYAEFIVPDEPAKANESKPVIHKSKWKRFCDYFFDGETWMSVLRKNAEQERELDQKYPWFELLHKYITVLCAIVLSIALVFWGIQSYANHVADNREIEVTEQKDKEHQDYIDQQEADRRAAEESREQLMKVAARIKAKVGFGSRNFIDVYNYGDADFMTLYQCMDNRRKNPMYANMTVEEMFFTEGQFIAAYDTNPVQDYYFNLAMKSEQLKYERESKELPEPVGSDYIYTIYTPHGIYLANDPKAPAYTWWRYSE